MVNEEVGGAENSQHLTGRAADIYTVEGNPLEFEQILDQQLWKNRALGYGVESNKGFTHVDLRQGRIRWYY
jgi:putative chitinase